MHHWSETTGLFLRSYALKVCLVIVLMLFTAFLAEKASENSLLHSCPRMLTDNRMLTDKIQSEFGGVSSGKTFEVRLWKPD